MALVILGFVLSVESAPLCSTFALHCPILTQVTLSGNRLHPLVHHLWSSQDHLSRSVWQDLQGFDSDILLTG